MRKYKKGSVQLYVILLLITVIAYAMYAATHPGGATPEKILSDAYSTLTGWAPISTPENYSEISTTTTTQKKVTPAKTSTTKVSNLFDRSNPGQPRFCNPGFQQVCAPCEANTGEPCPCACQLLEKPGYCPKGKNYIEYRPQGPQSAPTYYCDNSTNVSQCQKIATELYYCPSS